MLQISSWGKMFYIDYEEYRDYVDHFSGTITSSMVYIRNLIIIENKTKG